MITERTVDRIYELHAALLNAPWSGDLLGLTLATAVSVRLALAEGTSPVWLNLVGPSSTGKTSTVELLRGSDLVKPVSRLTPESLASGAVNEKGQRAKSLLPELHSKCLVMKDMGPFLSDDYKRVRKILGDLTDIFDGYFDKAVGTSWGESAVLSEQSTFAWLGCVKPDTERRHSRFMAELGSRTLAYRIYPERRQALVPPKTPTNRADIIKALRELVHEHIAALTDTVTNVTVPEDIKAIVWELAVLVSRGRTPMQSRPWIDASGRRRYEQVLGSTEEPHRAFQQLMNLLRSVAAAHGHSVPGSRELGLVQRVALSSVIADRADVLAAMRRAPVVRPITFTVTVDDQGNTETLDDELRGLTVQACARALQCSDDLARLLLDEMARVDLLVKDRQAVKDREGRPADFYRPVARFEPYIFNTLVASGDDGPIDHETVERILRDLEGASKPIRLVVPIRK